MKNLVFKTFAILVLSFFSISHSNAQMTACTPTALDPFPCGTACMEITVVNVNVPCGLSLYWGYSSCSQLIGFDAPIVAGTSSTKIGPCARCNDQLPCECPNKIMLMDQTNTLYWPWGDLTTLFSSGNSVYRNVQNICPGCDPKGVKVEITINSATKATIKFSCEP
jgi:hypothetical protein